MKEKLKTTKRTPIQTTQYKNTDSTGYYFPVNDPNSVKQIYLKILKVIKILNSKD
jgi:hypothetical protein